jgi:DNA modification methylase
MNLKDLTPNKKNPRKISDKKLDMLRQSLAKFGDLSGFVINRRTNTLVSGHQRQKALGDGEIKIQKQYTEPTKARTVAEGYVTIDGEKFKYREVDADAQWESEAMLAANKHGGEWDETLLKEIFAENISLELAGFELPELNALAIEPPAYEATPTEEKTPPKEEDETPIEPPADPKTKPGDLYLLGNHRLLCGDSTKKADVERLMDGKKADIIFTDPPYNVDYDYNFHPDKKTLEEYLVWTKEWVKRCGEFCNPDAWFFTKNAPKNLLDYSPIVREMEWDYRNLIVWVHPPHLFPSNRFYDNWEALVVFSRGKPSFNSHAETRMAERPISEGGGTHDNGRIGDVWDGIKYISAGAMASKEAILKPGTKSKAHPCQMPLALPERAIRFCSDTEMKVYEPFCGSGSTLIACQKTNRICYGMEIDPAYCDVIVARWEKYTGKKAVLTPA